MATTYTTLRLNTWSAYKKLVDDLSENWAYRGQANVEWGLENAIERTDFVQLYKGVEADFLAEFQRGAQNYLQKDQTPEHLIEWLALMQHHGAPTRLLDFSKSPFIGAYFAFEQCVPLPDQYLAIWAVNINFLRVQAIECLQGLFAAELERSENRIDEALFEKIFFQNSCSLIFPVEPFRMNRRYSLQQSIFVSTGNSYEPFMQQLGFLGDKIEKAVVKIELPSVLQKEVLRDLQKMNLHRASLFPDLDGYAVSLKLRYNSMRSSEELLADQLTKMEKNGLGLMP
jgi:FRG domain